MSDIRPIESNPVEVLHPSQLPSYRSVDGLPIVRHGHQDFVLVPVDRYRNERGDRTGLWLIAGVTTVAGLLLTAVAIRPAPSPVIIQQQPPTNPNCVLFCGG